VAGELDLHTETVAEIAARLDLREPNQLAVQTIAARVSQHFDVDDGQAPFEAVIDAATGVGKTYILVGALELFVHAFGIHDFVIVTPGRTILEKTKENFTPGSPKSVVDNLSFRPVVITSGNFATPTMRDAMDDPTQAKIYLFTVQALIRPETKGARKTHKFQEGLGTEFYAHLQNIDNLVVFADEHHTYYGPQFSSAVRDLKPWVLIGLTATPDKKTPEEQIIFRYPLAAAIADQLVKTPVIVGRRDDRTDALTKLSDGATLLEAKEQAIAAYCEGTEADHVNPVMLVVAKDTADADDYGEILRSSEFADGKYADAVLVVHSKQPDDALEALQHVEDPDSRVRIIISVGMLKEGWDVKNVYVIASMRALVSAILTEQTLGRGMRLPFGHYTGIEILDTLEVVAHERYEELLKKKDVLNEQFIDYRTYAATRVNADGKQVVVTETVKAETPVITGEIPDDIPGAPGAPVVTNTDERAAQAQGAVTRMQQTIERRPDAPEIVVPILKMTTIESKFSVADITDLESFRRLGSTLAANPEDELARTVVSARVVTGADGIKRTELITAPAADRVHAPSTLFALDDLRERLTEMVLGAPAVPARKDQRQAAQPLIDAFVEGLGPNAAEILSANLDRAGARLIRLVNEEQREFVAKPKFDEVVELRPFEATRTTDRKPTPDRLGKFVRSVAYDGWIRSLYPVEWFDSEPERRVANMVDDDDSVNCWVRLHIGELPILWNGFGNEYNPDLIVIDNDGTHWIVEVKMGKEMGAEDVKGKREAAKRWTNYVNADSSVKATWRYLLVSESDIRDAKNSWTALKRLGV
jgi:type III restriction enzyme